MKLKLGEIFDAIEKNGWPQIRGEMILYSEETSEIVGACAWGQAYLNLKERYPEQSNSALMSPSVFATRVGDAISHSSINPMMGALPRRVYLLNDTKEMPIVEIARYLRDSYRNYLDVELDV